MVQINLGGFMEILCKRRESKNDSTIGELWIEGKLVCYTLEDIVREVAGEPVEKWKVNEKTAIPSGRYKVTLETSSRFGPDTITLNKVPGFTSIRVHGGNTSADTEGCPLLGLKVDEAKGTIVGGTSKPAVDKLKKIVKEAFDKEQEVWWTVQLPGQVLC